MFLSAHLMRGESPPPTFQFPFSSDLAQIVVRAVAQFEYLAAYPFFSFVNQYAKFTRAESQIA